jgi:hypothetical protein
MNQKRMQEKTQIRNITDISAANLDADLHRIHDEQNHSGGEKDQDDEADYYTVTGGNTMRTRQGNQSTSKRLMYTSLDNIKSSMRDQMLQETTALDRPGKR